jgi:hypothetical protein
MRLSAPVMYHVSAIETSPGSKGCGLSSAFNLNYSVDVGVTIEKGANRKRAQEPTMKGKEKRQPKAIHLL